MAILSLRRSVVLSWLMLLTTPALSQPTPPPPTPEPPSDAPQPPPAPDGEATGEPTQPAAEPDSPPADKAAPAPAPSGAAWDIPAKPNEQTMPTGPSPECVGSEDCAERGLCTAWQGRCVAASIGDCRQSRYCKLGYCTPQNGECVIGSTQDCRMSEGCAKKGWCTRVGDECAAGADMDCARSAECATGNACRAVDGRCVVSLDAEDQAAVASNTKDMMPGAKVTGVVMVSGGLLTASVGSFLLLSRDTSYAGAANLIPLGATAIVIGIPLWALGATDIPVDSEPRNPTLLAGGTALAGFGASGITASAFLLVAAENDERRLPVATMSVSAAALIGGAIMAGYGATLVRSSDNLGRASQPLDINLMPEVNVGAGHAELTWQF